MGLFVPCLGGLGASQLGALVAALRVQASWAAIWTPENEQNQYQVDVERAFLVAPENALLTIGHSLGCDPAAAVGQKMVARRIILLEPVWGDKDVGNVPCDVYMSDGLIDFPRAKVAGSNVTVRVIKGTNHNTVCQHPDVVSGIVAAVNAERQNGGRPC